MMIYEGSMGAENDKITKKKTQSIPRQSENWRLQVTNQMAAVAIHQLTI